MLVLIWIHVGPTSPSARHSTPVRSRPQATNRLQTKSLIRNSLAAASTADEVGWRSFYDSDAPPVEWFSFLGHHDTNIGLWRATFYCYRSLRTSFALFKQKATEPRNVHASRPDARRSCSFQQCATVRKPCQREWRTYFCKPDRAPRDRTGWLGKSDSKCAGRPARSRWCKSTTMKE